MPWTLTVREGSRVHRNGFADLELVLDELEARGRALERSASSAAVDVRVRRFAPDEQVIARLELAGPKRLAPGVRAGVDIRGDGSAIAYVGRVRRAALKPRRGESAYDALRRELSQPT